MPNQNYVLVAFSPVVAVIFQSTYGLFLGHVPSTFSFYSSFIIIILYKLVDPWI